MIPMKYTWIILPLMVLMVGACDNQPVFPVEPQVAFLDIQPREVVQLEDSIVVTFSFQDGDGDLGLIAGANDTVNSNLVFIDSRLEEGRITPAQAEIPYRLPSLTPEARNPSIQGEVTIVLPVTAIIPPQRNFDSVRYQIKLYDRAGNLATPADGSEGGVYTDYVRITRN